jgi:hypothetical protein
MKDIRWVLQNNLIAENDRKQLQEACKEIGVEFEEVLVIPFSDELPEFTQDDKTNIYYGSTTLMDNVYKQLDKPKGLFFNHETFSMENYFKQWGEHMLSYGGEFMYVSEFIDDDLVGNTDFKVFIRPDGDGKEFDGTVGFESELKEMLTRMVEYEGPMNRESTILVAPAYNIQKEWRNYIVDGEIVTSTRYRNNFRLSKSGTDIPEDMLQFVRDRMKEYQPHDVFAMDIASTKHDDGTMHYYIIECGCMNSVGFYHADIKKYVEGVTNYMLDRQLVGMYKEVKSKIERK